MPQLYKHNKGKWLLSTAVSKNTASNEEKWRSLRGTPVMCHWTTLRPKINHKRGALWLRCGHPWSINLTPPPPLPLSFSASLSLSHSQIYTDVGEALNQHKWRMNCWHLQSYLYWLLEFWLLRLSSLRSWLKKMHYKCLLFESIYKTINCTFSLLMKKGPKITDRAKK